MQPITICHESVIYANHDGGQRNSLPHQPVLYNILHLGSVLTAGNGHRFAIDKKKKKKERSLGKTEEFNPSVSTDSSMTHFCFKQHCGVSAELACLLRFFYLSLNL